MTLIIIIHTFNNCQVKNPTEKGRLVIQATASSTHYLDDDDVIGSY